MNAYLEARSEIVSESIYYAPMRRQPWWAFWKKPEPVGPVQFTGFRSLALEEYTRERQIDQVVLATLLDLAKGWTWPAHIVARRVTEGPGYCRDTFYNHAIALWRLPDKEIGW